VESEKVQTIAIRRDEQNKTASYNHVQQKYSVNAPPGTIENRVFIGGNYALMPVLRVIEKSVLASGFQPIIAYDFNIPREKTREYSLRLLCQCKFAIFESTINDGHLVESARANAMEICILQVYMAMDGRKKQPKMMSTMIWQSTPSPKGYVTFDELQEIIQRFLPLSSLSKITLNEEPSVFEPDYEEPSDFEPEQEEPEYEEPEQEEPEYEEPEQEEPEYEEPEQEEPEYDEPPTES
jgi:hypothetical protein